VPRRLSAILIADVVGYSRLVETDEAGTLAALKQRWKTVLEPIVRERGGRIVKEMGDGVLVEFASAVDALVAGDELQQRMQVANEGLPHDRQIVLRIGINLGEVIGEGSDIYGESVNIAARLEALSEPGGLCISEKVFGEVRGKVDICFEDIGEQQLKNITAPIRAYLTRTGANTQPARHLSQSSDPSIAVLPFADLSGEQDQRYFSDGITEDIITELSRFKQLEVVARNSSFRFRGTDLDMIKVGRELGVAYLLEGSVRRIGTRIRITAQLIDAKSGHHLWAEKFDRDREEIFAIQDQVVQTLVATLVGRLQTAIVERAKRKPPSNLAAYECVLRADALPFADADSEVEARRLLEKAIALDPGYARAFAYMGNSYRLEWSRDMSGSDELLDQALLFAQKSVALDENNDACHQDLGWILIHRNYDLAEHHLHKALQLNPNRPSTLTSIGCLHAYLGRPDEALEYFKAARSLDPLFEPSWYWRMLGIVFFVARRHDEAIAAFKKSPIIPFWVHGYLAACYVHTDRIADAKRHAAEALRLAPDFSVIQSAAKDPFQRETDRQHLIEGMRKAGLPD
jgi:adenylate cyclase